MNLDEDHGRYSSIFALPRDQWITLPDQPSLSPIEQDFILGQLLFLHGNEFPSPIGDYCSKDDIVEIIPKSPSFTARDLSAWSAKVEMIERLYRAECKEQIGYRDPYSMIRF